MTPRSLDALVAEKVKSCGTIVHMLGTVHVIYHDGKETRSFCGLSEGSRLPLKWKDEPTCRRCVKGYNAALKAVGVLP